MIFSKIMDINYNVKKLKNDGVTTIECVFSKNEYENYVKKCNELFELLLKKKINKMSKDIRRMPHYYSTPPKNDHLRISTVVRS